MISESSRFFTSLPLPRSCVSLFGGTVLEVLGRAFLSSKTESSASAIRGRFGSGSSPSPSWGVEVVVESYDEAGQHLGTGFIVFLPFYNFPTWWHGSIGRGVLWCGSLCTSLGGSGPLNGSHQLGWQFPPPSDIFRKTPGWKVVSRPRPISPTELLSSSLGHSKIRSRNDWAFNSLILGIFTRL
jgi:hypothetical protein